MFSKEFKVTLFLGKTITGQESRLVSGFKLSVRPLIGESLWYYDKLYRITEISHKIPSNEFILILEKFDN